MPLQIFTRLRVINQEARAHRKRSLVAVQSALRSKLRNRKGLESSQKLAGLGRIRGAEVLPVTRVERYSKRRLGIQPRWAAESLELSGEYLLASKERNLFLWILGQAEVTALGDSSAVSWLWDSTRFAKSVCR